MQAWLLIFQPAQISAALITKNILFFISLLQAQRGAMYSYHTKVEFFPLHLDGIRKHHKYSLNKVNCNLR